MVFAACTPKEETKNDKTDEAVKVEVATGVEREVEETGSYTGTVEAFVTNNIAPQANGRIKKVLVEVGDHVRAGQTIATMDDVTLAQAKLQMDNNELEFNRVDELYKIGGTSKSEWDSKKLALDISRRNYNNLLENTTLVSPISGIVTKPHLRHRVATQLRQRRYVSRQRPALHHREDYAGETACQRVGVALHKD